MKRWSPEESRSECLRHYGNMRQLCGLKRYTFSDGKAAGIEAVDVETGGGLRFTVLPGRGMDISEMRYCGIPIAYLSKAGITAPSYHDPREDQWLKSFFGGMLTTCGLTNAGPACRDDIGMLTDIPFGLHGDISNIAADNVCTCETWKDGRYHMTVSGRMEEGRLHGEHLQLRRTVETCLGEKRLWIHDVFSNEGELPQLIMFFYHINIGHPILSSKARFIAPSRKVWAETSHAKKNIDCYDRCSDPMPGYPEEQFFHEMGSDEHGNTLCALVNDDLELAFYLRYNVHELPNIAQWKVFRETDYVLAFEPGNCHAIGRLRQKDQNAEFLAPMHTRETHLELGIIEGRTEIARLEKEVQNKR